MARVTVLAHLPRLRISSDQVSLPFGWRLVKPTWESFDRVAGGRFEGWASKYEAADPVFLFVEDDLDLDIVRPGRATNWAELKVPAAQWDELLPRMLGSTFLNFFHDRVVDVIWGAFMLAVPGAGPGRPRSSLTMLIPEEGFSVRVAGQDVAGVRVQGEADQEYIFSADTACLPLSDDEVTSALLLLETADRANKSDRLRPALQQLLSTTEPTLTPGDRLVLSVSAMESLLLPDVRSGQQDAFASQLIDLHGSEVEPVARNLYRARSSAVHDGPDAERVSAVPPGQAEQMLAETIIALAPGSQEGAEQHGDPTFGPRGTASANRLLPRPVWFSAQLIQGGSLSPHEGYVASWSPLVGLTCAPDTHYRSNPECDLVPLSPREIVGMEEKDVRRDFIARFLLEEDLVATLRVVQEADPNLSIDDRSMASALRSRDLTVAGMRLGGLHEFVDPELLGWYVYHHNVRFRRETVLRQTVLMGLGDQSNVELTEIVMAPVKRAWQVLLAYETNGRSEEIETALHLLRRGHDPFAPAEVQVSLLFCALEGMLGRFRPPRNEVQLEDLVAKLPALEQDKEWFSSRARVLRNETAHGTWARPTAAEESASELAKLRRITGAAVSELLSTWIDSHGSSAGGSPSATLVRALQRRLT